MKTKERSDSLKPQPGDLVQVYSWGKTPVMIGVLIKVYAKDKFHQNETLEYFVYEVLCWESGQIFSYDEPHYAVRKAE